MLAIHDQLIHEMCDRLKTTGIGLGLVRLLQNAKRFDEARETLYLLEEGFQGVESQIQSEPEFSQPPTSYFATVIAATERNASVVRGSGSSA